MTRKYNKRPIKVRIDEALAEQEKRLRYQFDIEYAKEIERRIDASLDSRNKELRELAHIIKFRLGILSIDEYNLLLKCLHPDTVAHLGDDTLTERFNRAFKLLMAKQKVLLPEKFAKTKEVELFPQTYEELKARQAAE